MATMERDMMFEVATRAKLRFPFKGQISVEDLWDLSIEDLDSIYKNLNSQVKKAQEESLLQKRTKEDEVLSTKIEIVRYIFNVKVEEQEKRKRAKERKEQRQKIMEIMAAKQDEALRNKSLEELQAMLAETEEEE